MKFENAFDVQAPIDDVYAALLDVERVAPCMPGAEVVEKTGDDAYKVAIKVKVGPMSMTYKGDVEIVERDEAAKTATMRAKAKEARGQGTVDAHVRMALSEQAERTHATLETEVQMSGRAAAMGRGVIADVAGKLTQTFAGNLAEMLESAPSETVAASTSNGAPRAQQPASALAATAGPAAASLDEPVATEWSGTSSSAPGKPPKQAEESALPAGEIAASVIAGRLSDPKTLLASAAIFGMLCVVLGYLLGRKG